MRGPVFITLFYDPSLHPPYPQPPWLSVDHLRARRTYYLERTHSSTHTSQKCHAIMNCYDAEPCDWPEIEWTLEMESLMTSEGLELVQSALDPWLMATGDLIDTINIDPSLWNAHRTMHSSRSTPQHPLTLSINGNLVDMTPDYPWTYLRHYIHLISAFTCDKLCLFLNAAHV